MRRRLCLGVGHEKRKGASLRFPYKLIDVMAATSALVALKSWKYHAADNSSYLSTDDVVSSPVKTPALYT